MKHYEEKNGYEQLIRSLSEVCKLDEAHRTITPKAGVQIGIHRLGMIDFLVNYKGWRLVKGL